ncbi:ATP-binding protein [Nocardioides sp. GY 10127]|uniref:sensor histidine kinase n=1 Tax=Nocardioides sp. GY 10127 TaxID=2569762 RepID=UPI0010A8EDB9|nr:ATP-binding protein [Nocardioides sp. GY 10127]TIC82731.1 hypothetical protein E8D37_08560 [Nocardioides sp. GY 10127]
MSPSRAGGSATGHVPLQGDLHSAASAARARQYWWVNAAAVGSSTLALAAAYVAGARSVSIAQDLVVMGLALGVLLVSAPWLHRAEGRVAGFSVLASTVVFSLGAVWVTPFLSPLAVLALLVPLMVTIPLLDRRLLLITTVTVVVSSGVAAGVAEHRRVALPEVDSIGPVVSVVIFSPIIVAVVAWVVLDTYRRLESQAAALRVANERVVRAADAARRTLERDLHDGAQQRLVGLSLRLGQIRRLTETSDCHVVQAALDEAVQQNLEAVRELRELARGIYPAVLTERGLVAALRAAALQAPVSCVVLDAGVPRYPEAVEAAVYFTVMEALTNATKHAAAQEVRVELRDEAGPAFVVADDGRGFDPAAVGAEGGLAGLEARVEALGGVLRVESAPGRGTRVEGVVPAVAV